MKYSKCEICGNWGWESHTCPPVFEVASIDGPEDVTIDWDEIDRIFGIRRVYAQDDESAAEQYMSYYHGDYGYCERMDILVRGKDGHVKHFEVVAEMVPRYSATEKEITSPKS